MSHELLVAFEKALDPARPTANDFGCEIIDYGEVSAVLALAGLPGRVLKRMSGLRSAAEANAYASVVRRYLADLADLGLPTLRTELLALEPQPGRHVVYLVQPRIDRAHCGQALLRSAPDARLCSLVESVLASIQRVLCANAARTDGRELAIDPQLSNWHWPDEDAAPVLLDVGTPFVRRGRRLEMDREIFLRAFPAPLRPWLRRQAVVEKYIADYFHFDRCVVDLLGNFVKEGAAERIPLALGAANRWIVRRPDLAALGPIDERRVRDYYARDADTLEWMLRMRRVARWVDTRLLRRRYDYILPGRILR